MFLTVFVGAFFFVALIVWVFFEFYSLDGGGKPAYDAEKYRCSQLLQGGRNGDAPDDSASEPRIVVLVAKTPTTKLAARIVLGFAAALVGLWIWGFVDAASTAEIEVVNPVGIHAARIVQLNPVSRSGYLCYLKLSENKKARSEKADEETAPKRRRRRNNDEDKEDADRYRRR